MQVDTDVNSQNHFQVADVLILDTFYHTLFKYFIIYDFNISLELWGKKLIESQWFQKILKYLDYFFY